MKTNYDIYGKLHLSIIYVAYRVITGVRSIKWLVDELSVIGDMRAEDFGIFAVFILVCAVIAWTMT